MIAKGGYVYILSNKHRTVLYVGVTSNLYNRIWQHKSLEGSKFTKKYNCTDLVYYQFYDLIESAIEQEKKLKKWKRAWKEDLIRKFNPEMYDLFEEISEMQ